MFTVNLAHREKLSYWPFLASVGLPRWHSGKESACQCRRCKRCGFDPWVGKIPWSRKWQPTPVFLPGKLHGQRSLVVYSPWGCKELHMTECAHTHTFTHIHIYGKVTFLGFWFNNSYSGNQVESPHWTWFFFTHQCKYTILPQGLSLLLPSHHLFRRVWIFPRWKILIF